MADWTEREVLGWTLVNTIMKLTVLQTELLYQMSDYQLPSNDNQGIVKL